MSFAKLRLKASKVFAVILILFICFTQFISISPIISECEFALGVFLAGICVIGRIWCSLFISGYKNNQLVQTGPYSIYRNPLYFFSFVGAVGIGLTTESLIIPIIVIICFAFYYPFVIKKEQLFLTGIYGEEYKKYLKAVPCFFPKFSLYKEPEEYIVKPKRFRKFLTEVIWFIWIIGIMEAIEMLKESHLMPVYFHIY